MEAVGRSRHELRHLRDVAARFLHSHDVRMRRELMDSSRQQVDARQRGEVVEEHGHGRGVGDRRVVADERLGRHLVLEESRRAHEHEVGAMLGRALRRAHCRLRRLAAGADDERATSRNRLARGDDDAVRFEVVEEHRLAVRPEHDEAGERSGHPALERRAQPPRIDAIVFVERRWNRSEYTRKNHRSDCISAKKKNSSSRLRLFVAKRRGQKSYR